MPKFCNREEYLASSYRPDLDFIEGELLERNVGEWDHSRLQLLLLTHLVRFEKVGFFVASELR